MANEIVQIVAMKETINSREMVWLNFDFIFKRANNSYHAHQSIALNHSRLCQFTSDIIYTTMFLTLFHLRFCVETDGRTGVWCMGKWVIARAEHREIHWYNFEHMAPDTRNDAILRIR